MLTRSSNAEVLVRDATRAGGASHDALLSALHSRRDDR